MSVLAVCRVVSCRTWPGQAAQRRMLDRDPRAIGRFDLSTFLSAPVSASETSTIGKPMKGATEYIETVGEAQKAWYGLRNQRWYAD